MLWYYREIKSHNLELDGIDVVIIVPLHKGCKQLNENQYMGAVDYHLHPGSSSFPCTGPSAAEILAEAASQASSSQQTPLFAVSVVHLPSLCPAARCDTEPLLSYIQRAKNTSLEAYV